jgi:hypothetical protein
MPYGLPGALKLPACKAMLNDRIVLLPEGTVCQPLFPCADQDGYDGHWMVFVPKLGNVILEKEAFL